MRPNRESETAKAALEAAVGDGRRNQPGDVLWTKGALHALGRYPTGECASPVLDRALHEAIRSYQRDRGLKRDGWLAPDGETECSLGFDLASLEGA